MSYPRDPYNRAPSPRPLDRSSSPHRQPSPNTVGQLTYTTTTGPDGKTVYYCLFKADFASYQTSDGPLSGIQWVLTGVTQTLPSNAVPANTDTQQSWQREEKRRKEKDAARREKGRRKRERVEEPEPREVRERDGQAQYQPSEFRPGTERVSPYSVPGNLPGSVSPYQSEGYLPGPSPVSPYQSGGALPGQQPVSPYHGGSQLPGQRSVSPYHGGGQFPSQRPVSPYHSGGVLLGQRPVSPYHIGGSLPSNKPPISPYRSGGALPGTKPISPYRSGGALPSPNKPISPYYNNRNLPSTDYSNPNYGSSHNDVEKKMDQMTIGGRAAGYHARGEGAGYQPAPGGGHPSGTTGSHYTTSATVPSRSPYNSMGLIQPRLATRDSRSRGTSPSSYEYQPPPQLQPEEGILPLPDCFGRPPDPAQSYIRFDRFKVLDMDGLKDNMPTMPDVLATHDVYREDWIWFMRDLSNAWLDRLPVTDADKQGGLVPRRSVMATYLVQHWNASFFDPRGVELIVYRGRKRKNGRYAGRVDTDLPGFAITADDITDSSDEFTESDSEDDYVPPRGTRYDNHTDVYGRQDSAAVEAQIARMRRKKVREEERRERKEDEVRKRVKKLERKYTMFLACLH